MPPERLSPDSAQPTLDVSRAAVATDAAPPAPPRATAAPAASHHDATAELLRDARATLNALNEVLTRAISVEHRGVLRDVYPVVSTLRHAILRHSEERSPDSGAELLTEQRAAARVVAQATAWLDRDDPVKAKAERQAAKEAVQRERGLASGSSLDTEVEENTAIGVAMRTRKLVSPDRP